MPKHTSLQVCLAAAVGLAGLGHYYLLFLPSYPWDALLFHAVAAVMLGRAYVRAALGARARDAAGRGVWPPRAEVWMSSSGVPTKTSVALIAAANGLAALLAAALEPPLGIVPVLLAWIAPLTALVALAGRHRAADLAPAQPAAGGQPEVTPLPAEEIEPPFEAGLREIVLAVAGWLLLAVGLWLVGLPEAAPWLSGFDSFARDLTERFRVDVVATPGAWVLGLVALGLGLLLVFLGRGGVGHLRGGLQADAALAPPPKGASPGLSMGRRWRSVAIWGAATWLVVLLSAAVGSTSRAIGLLWVAAMGLLAARVWQADRAREVAVLPAGVDRSVWLIVAALAPALLVAVYRLTDIPASFWGDEGAHWWLAKALAEGLQQNPFGLGVYNAHPVAVTVYHSMWLRLLGATLWSWRLGSAVAGVLAIVPLFLLARRVLGSRVAWSSAVLLVTMPCFLSYSRLGLYAIQPIMPAVLGIWLLVESVRGGSWLLAFLAGLSCGLASLAYAPGHAALAISLLLLVVVYAGRKWLRRSILRVGLLLIAGWICAAGPFFLGTGLLGGEPVGGKLAENFLGNVFYAESVFPQSGVSALPAVQVAGQELFFDGKLYALLITRGVLRAGLNVVSDWVVHQHYLVGPLAGPAVLFFLVGFAWTLARGRRWELLLWPIWVVVGVLMLSALNSFPPRVAHTTVVFPAVAVLGAVGIWLVVELVRRFVPFRWVDGLGVMLVGVVAVSGLYTYYVKMPERYRPGLDDVILWRGMEAEAGSSLLYISDPSHPYGYRRWGKDDYDLGFEIAATIEDVPRDRLGEADLAALCGGNCRVFFVPDEEVDLLAKIEAQLGGGSVLEHRNYWEETIGVEFVPGAADGG
jgi:hypothetical protein